jgi:thiol:disulfide interchange protein
MAQNKEIPGVLLYFWSPSCVPCRTFEKSVLDTPAFRDAFATLPLLRIQLDGSMSEIKRSLQYGVKAAPTLVVIDQSLRSHPIDVSVQSEQPWEENRADQVVKRVKVVLQESLS